MYLALTLPMELKTMEVKILLVGGFFNKMELDYIGINSLLLLK
jgi:hypothetical protein